MGSKVKANWHLNQCERKIFIKTYEFIDLNNKKMEKNVNRQIQWLDGRQRYLLI